MLCCAILVVVVLAIRAVAVPDSAAPLAKTTAGNDNNDGIGNGVGTGMLWYFDASETSQNVCNQTTWAYATSKKARVRDCVDLAVDLTRRTGSYLVGSFTGAGDDYAVVARRGTCTLGLKRMDSDYKGTGCWTVGDSDVVEIVKEAVSKLGRSQAVSGVGTMKCEYRGGGTSTERIMMWRLWGAESH